ncbi:Hypothetical predicted protein [Mytilus galloprovincialis]|uniref:Conodipine-M alpha chain n=1 Tax=Mytilus galloprovincialis TaxID=29158 RepID=A0A8B6HNE5_MYTGA|nr:Hypothetical predicted protein [Mytilus galloprovincialis]
MDINFVRLSAVFLIIISYLRPIITVESKRCFQPNPGLSNGCSIPFGIELKFKINFTPACQRHDICYTCASKFAKSREYCDSLFLKDMQKVCNMIEVAKREECNNYANTYHTGVQVGGERSFMKTAKCQCNQKWVPSCFP